MPDRVLVSPDLDYQPSLHLADSFLRGQYVLPGGLVRITTSTPWESDAPNKQWAEDLHSFEWLGHFAARPGEETERHAQWLVNSWLQKYKNFHVQTWAPHVLGRRVTSWLTNWPLISGQADMIWKSYVLRDLARQVRHLRRVAHLAPAGMPQIEAALGLVYGSMCLIGNQKSLQRGLGLLEQALGAQVLADGGHKSRSPSTTMALLNKLLILKSTLIVAGEAPSPVLTRAIDRMAPAVDFFRLGDGLLHLAHGGGEGVIEDIQKATAGDKSGNSPLGQLPQSGYHRMAVKKTVLIVDCDKPAGFPFARDAHAAPLAFELSVGKQRVVVNCGDAIVQGPHWHDAMRGPAAHSTLMFDSGSLAECLESGTAHDLFGPQMITDDFSVSVERHEQEEGIWLELSHDGYAAAAGLVHERRLFLASDGLDLRGEDRLVASDIKGSRVPRQALIRFHLHPDVRTSLARDRSNVLLLLPKRQGWQFRVSGAELSLEESVYLGDGESVRRTNQIVLTVDLPEDGMSVKWAFKKHS